MATEFKDDDQQQEFKAYVKTYSENVGHPLRILRGFYRGSGWTMFKSTLALICQRSPVWVTPIVTANIINIATNPSAHTTTELWLNLLVGFVFIAQNVLAAYTVTRNYNKVVRNIEMQLRSTIVRKLQQLSISFHKAMQSGRLQSKIMRDVENVEVLLTQWFSNLVFIVLDVAIAVVVTLQKSPAVLLFFVLTIPGAVLLLYLFRKPIAQKNTDFRKEVENTQAAVAEMVELIPVTRAHGLQGLEIDRMNDQLRRVRSKGFALDKTNSLFGASNWVMFQLFQLFCLGFTAFMAYQGKITVGEVVLYQTYFTQIVAQISNLINLYPNFSKGLESVQSVGEIIACNNLERYKYQDKIEDLKGDIRFDHVQYHYDDDEKLVLTDFNLHILPGERVAFVGGSGTGKSTILNLVIGFNAPTGGGIYIDGRNMAALDLHSFRQQISVVPQNSILFSGSIRDNIAYGRPEVSDAQIMAVVEQLGLEDMLATMPKGLDTVLNEHGARLSGGQRQRISIARAMLRDPRIIIFDEATSALDNASEKQVQRAINTLMQGRTTLMVAHRLSTIQGADRIVVVEDGRVAEMGTYQELLDKRGAFYHLSHPQA
ncbi:MAG: ABC transporter ATP-binding protein [Gemmiger sp.]|nr:ABC transporter ATP-binding protein [Gemmiger sp.]